MYGINSTLLEYMKSKASSTTELSDILRLVEIIPIDNGELKKSINAKFSLKDDDNNIDDKTLRLLFGQEDDEDAADDKKKKIDTISFRDIVRLLIKFLKGADLKEAKIALGGRLEELHK
jgi:hypothetical protein